MMLWLPAALAGPATAQSATRDALAITAARRAETVVTEERLLHV
jgi:hypothetical protein